MNIRKGREQMKGKWVMLNVSVFAIIGFLLILSSPIIANGTEVKTTSNRLIREDANGDGVVNALDITKVERVIVEMDAPTCITNPSDNNSLNGIITIGTTNR